MTSDFPERNETGAYSWTPPADFSSTPYQFAPQPLPIPDGPWNAPYISAHLAQLYGLADPGHIDLRQLRQPRRHALRIPIGCTADDGTVELDFPQEPERRAAVSVIGASGYGKSELLRTVVLGAALRYSPQDVNVLLVDFFGEGTFDPLAGLPHVAGVISGVVQDLSLADRFAETLGGEIERRRELLAATGFYNIHDYERARAAGADLDALPPLLVVIDRCDELLARRPRLAEVLLAGLSLGRSHGFALVLAAQDLRVREMREINGHMTHRIVVGAVSGADSRELLGVDETYLPTPSPGYAHIRAHDDTGPTRFAVAYSAEVHPSPFDVGPSYGGKYRPLIEVLVPQILRDGPAAHGIWLPPLAAPPTLDQLLGYVSPQPGDAPLAVLGFVDRPRLQRRDLLVLDPTGVRGNTVVGEGGNTAVVGAAGSGKSTALRTLIAALSLTHDARQVQFYCLDLRGDLRCLADLPHVGAMAGPDDEELARRIVAEATALVRCRASRFSAASIESMARFRRMRADSAGDSAVGDDPFGDVIVVIDDLRALLDRFPGLERSITDLASQGPSYGVHLVVAMAGWFQAPRALRERFGAGIELRLHDPDDSAFDSQAAATVPAGLPGSGTVTAGGRVRVALPRIDGRGDNDQPEAAVAALVAKVRAGAQGWRAPGVRLLPGSVDHAELLRQNGIRYADDRACLRFPIGIGESELAPVSFDFAADPHLIVVGEPGCGKTSALRSLIATICAANTTDQARLILIDQRRTGTQAHIPQEYIALSAADLSTSGPLWDDLIAYLGKRLPGPGVTPSQLRDRSWWSGPEIFVVIDDYGFLPPGDAMRDLVEYLRFARDIGLHLIVSCGIGALDDPLLRRLRDLGAGALVMSGGPDDGEPIGVRARPLPPGRGTLVTRHGQELVQTARPPA
ncbi:putative FtsK/SpoIIIE family protein [Nocardia nova SH22a]|uniref:Putative FtsK/SpoIIIE family protein n=1 Tax=Nocardia nova SH22a TaxID=1415166 RepID=W5TKY9_9NOCA|nr:type VII secretion protein EccCb [Nocardia nova]AHH19643.1 putative FtsK/SpoIIIE family protein [Nocardia nova SH22a]